MAQNTRTIFLAVCALALTACGEREAAAPPAAPPQAPVAQQPAAELSREQLDARRIADLVAINNALLAHHRQHGTYPVTPQGGFTNVVSAGQNWIPGLAPNFISELPREPRLSDDAQLQYWYASNGTDYKLIVVGVPNHCGSEIERDGVRIDPARTRNGGCWAYGFWTQGRRNF